MDEPGVVHRVRAAALVGAGLLAASALVACPAPSGAPSEPPPADGGASRRRPPPEQMSDDERRVREEMGVPRQARLMSLVVAPETGGLLGREGLRIVAVFDLGADVEAYRRRAAGLPGWRPLPLSPAARRLREPPSELPRPHRGLGYCRIGVWRTGMQYDPYPCDVAARADHYRAAVLDLDNAGLFVVFKNYY